MAGAGVDVSLGETTLIDQSGIADATQAATEGTVGLSQYCDDIPTKQNQTFANAYHQAYGQWPAYHSEAGHTKAEILVAALKKLNGNATTPKKLVKAAKSVKIVAPRGPVSVNEQADMPIEDIYACKVEVKDGSLRDVPVKTYSHVQPWGTLTFKTFMTAMTKQSSGRPS